MKANRTGKQNPPPKIEDLSDGTFYYNFNVQESKLKNEDGGKMYTNWDYDQVRCNYPIEKSEIQLEVDNQGYEHTVEIEE